MAPPATLSWLLASLVAGWVIEASSPALALDLDAAAPRAVYSIRITANADAFPSAEEAAHRGDVRVTGDIVNSRTPALASVVEVRARLTHNETGAEAEASYLVDATLSASLGLKLPWIEGPCPEMPGCEKTLTLTFEMVEPSMDDTVDVDFRVIATLEGPPGQPPPDREPRLAIEVVRVE